MRASRFWHGAIAVIVVAALAIQLAIAIDAPTLPAAHAVGTLRGTFLVGRIVRMLSFFTIQSNILCGIGAALVARRPDRTGPVWRVVRLAGLFGITVTGVVYSTVLAKMHEPNGWAETSTNLAFHYLVPIAVVVGWVAFGPRPRIDRISAIALAWPLLWAAWTLAHGAIAHWYPYPFVDVATHGYVRVVVNAVAVVAVLAVVTAAFAWADTKLPPTPSPSAVATPTRRSHVAPRRSSGA